MSTEGNFTELNEICAPVYLCNMMADLVNLAICYRSAMAVGVYPSFCGKLLLLRPRRLCTDNGSLQVGQCHS